MANVLFLFLGALFVPAVIYMSEHVYERMHPPKQLPIAFLLFGLFLISAGLFFVYLLVSAAMSGSAPCPLKGCSSSFDISRQPRAYWAALLALYFYAVSLFSAGVAAIQRSIREP